MCLSAASKRPTRARETGAYTVRNARPYSCGKELKLPGEVASQQHWAALQGVSGVRCKVGLKTCSAARAMLLQESSASYTLPLA